ncbi:MAG: sulfatase-like hydrolase/transferase [Chthoniobacterales bacterium]
MSSPPNILFIFPDQWRSDALSCLGHPVAITPHVDQLAAKGTTFTSAYSNCPICIPARACLMSGRTPNGVGRFGWHTGLPFQAYEPSMMTCLRDGGYQTMLSGKTHFHPERLHLGYEQMVLADADSDAGNDYTRWLTAQTGARLQPNLKRLNGNSLIVEPWTHDESLHNTNFTTAAALRMLENRDPTRPFFLQVGYHRPHPPFDPPVEYWVRFRDVELPPVPRGTWAERFDLPTADPEAETGRMHPTLFDRMRRGYFASIAHVDSQIGELITHLKRNGLFEKTLIVFCSDHGEQLGDHWLYRKSTALEGSAGIPLIVKPPADWQCPRGNQIQAPVALHDIMPTLLDAANAPTPESVEGKSLLPLVRDGRASWRTHVHCEQCHGPLGAWQCVTDGKRKYVWLSESGDELFFDLEIDPREQTNLADQADRADEIKVWRDRLISELAQRSEDGFVNDGRLVPGTRTPTARQWLIEWEAGAK